MALKVVASGHLQRWQKSKSSYPTLQQKNSVEMLRVTIQGKDAERLSLISQAKSLEETMSDADRKVINTHNEQAISILSEMAGNPTTYDGAVREAKFRIVDKHLATIQKIVQMHAFASNMNGGMFASQKNLAGIHSRAAVAQSQFHHSPKIQAISAPTFQRVQDALADLAMQVSKDFSN